MTIRQGDRVLIKNAKVSTTGTVISGITYRRNGARRLPQVKVRHDIPAPNGETEWHVLTRNLTVIDPGDARVE